MPPEDVVSQMQGSAQVSDSTAARNMNRQSRAMARLPVLNGCEQSPWSANADVTGTSEIVERKRNARTPARAVV
jgi:hypothetical protein